jgi:O-antigen/teichoic acid export membrane protein
MEQISTMKEDSLKKRYAYKLFSKLVSFSLGFITLGLIPRAFGPSQYGDFAFLTFFFSRVTKFLNMGISAAFYTKISSRQEERKLVTFYIYFLGFIFFLMFIGVAGILFFDFNNVIWPKQKSIFIWAAALFSMMSYTSRFVSLLNDAYGLTVKSEYLFVLQSIFSTVLILALYYTENLDLSKYFILQYVLLGFIIIGGWRVLNRHKVHFLGNLRLMKVEAYRYIKEFYEYVHPLFIYSFFVFVTGVGDRWLLQYFSGSKQQGYFGLAFKIGAICFLFSESMSQLIRREMSASYEEADYERMTQLFNKFVPMFYFATAYFAMFVSINAEKVCLIVGGNKYKESSLVIAIMVFYPIHQTYGRLCGSVLLASGQTKLIRNIGVSTLLVGIFLAFLFLAPTRLFGFNMGAVGLALKMVIVQCVAVNIQLWFNSRFLKLSFLKFLCHQIIVIFLLSFLAVLTKSFTSFVTDRLFISFFLNGALYSLAVAILLMFFPMLISMTKNDLIRHLNYFKKLVKARVLKSQTNG